MRPPFVSKAMADKLLRSGKTLIFLRYAPPDRCTGSDPISQLHGHEGTRQGGVIPPLLANIALLIMEILLKDFAAKRRVGTHGKWAQNAIVNGRQLKKSASRCVAGSGHAAGLKLAFVRCRECCGDAEFEQSLARTPMAAAAAQLSHGQVCMHTEHFYPTSQPRPCSLTCSNAVYLITP